MATINATEYSEKLQNPARYFRDPAIQQGSAVKGKKPGSLYSAQGANAITFKFVDAGQRTVAVRCFLHDTYLKSGDLTERYAAISAFIASSHYPGFAAFQFQPDGVLHGGEWLPLLVMEWVEGVSLTSYVKRHIGDFGTITALAQNFRALAGDLKRFGVAHGDLQHGNILVDAAGNLRLVDYDGMFVPALAGKSAIELGERNYQSPQRTPDDFHAQLDHFPAITIYLSLVALAQAPRLLPLDAKNKLDYLLTSERDLKAPTQSGLFQCLWDLGLRAPSERLAALCDARDLRTIPDLETFIDQTDLELPTSRLTSRPPTPCEAVMVDQSRLDSAISESAPASK
jgi:serine/threonine protein kinase